MSLIAGRRLGPYEIQAAIGAGGMGVVYRAQDTRLGRLVALKFLSPELSSDAKALERFHREAAVAATLEHPNLCTIHEITTTGDGQTFIAMPLYSGCTLKARLSEGGLLPPEAIAIAIQMSEGLAHAHAHGVVHRDITPANVMLTDGGGLKLLDFGLAILADRGVTTGSRIAGTIAYMSPEQVLGADVDARTDVWSTGVVLYEMLVARTPFEGHSDYTVLDGILHQAPLPLTDFNQDIPELVESIVFKCLQKKPEHRYDSAIALLTELRSARAALLHETGPAMTAAVEPPYERGLVTGERRVATVVGIRVAPRRPSSSAPTAEMAAALAESTLQVGEAVRQRYGVAVNYGSGDTFHAIFGAPRVIEHAPAQAVSAAMDIRAEIAGIGAEHGGDPLFSARIAIHTGHVVIAAVETGPSPANTVVTGDAVDEALSLLDGCPAEKVVVSASTHRLARGFFSYGPAIPFKQASHPEQQLFEVLSLHPDEGVQPSEGLEGPLAGRANELDQLQLHVFKLLNGTGSIVSVVGDAGVGKSRLIGELMTKEEISRVSVFTGRALPFGQHLSFHPLISILKQWAGIGGHDSPTVAFRKLEQCVQSSVSADTLQEILPFVAIVVGLAIPEPLRARVRHLDGQALEKLICVNLRRLMSALAGQRPLVIVLEDLHWADASTIDLLSCLFRLVPENRVLFLLTSRPGYTAGERVLTSIRTRYAGAYAEIRLEALSPRDAESMVRNLFRTQHVPQAIKDLLIQKSGRNPLFLEELARSLIDAGAIGRSGTHFTFEEVGSVVVPESIAGTILSRVDKLEPNTRLLLKVAAVIGPTVLDRLLAVTARPESDYALQLRKLEDAEVLVRRQDVGEREYAFRHVLVQEVVYEAILPHQRAALHLKIARAIEAAFASRIAEFYGMLAYHYCRADHPDSAYEYLMKAGDHALQSSASTEAVQYYKDALALYLKKVPGADPAKIAALERNIALAYYNKGLYSDAVTHFDRLHPHLLGRVPRTVPAKVWTAGIGLLHVLIGLYAPALKWKRQPSEADADWINVFYCKLMAMGHRDPARVVVEALLLAGRVTSFNLRQLPNGVAMYAGLSLAFSWTGISLRLSRRILAFLADKFDADDDRATLYYCTDRITLDFFSGEWAERPLDNEVVSRGTKIGEIFSLANYIVFHGRMAIEQGRRAEAENSAAVLHDIGMTFDHDYPLALERLLRTKLQLKYRRVREGLEQAGEGLALAGQLGLGTLVLGLHSIRARLILMAGDIGSARAELAEAAEVLTQTRVTPCYRSEYLLARTELSLAEIRTDANARATVRTAIAVAKRAVRNARTVASDQAEAYRLLGECYRAAGQERRALDTWRISGEIAARLGAGLELARTHAAIGAHLCSRSSSERILALKGAEHLDRAACLCREAGLAFEGAVAELAPKRSSV